MKCQFKVLRNSENYLLDASGNGVISFRRAKHYYDNASFRSLRKDMNVARLIYWINPTDDEMKHLLAERMKCEFYQHFKVVSQSGNTFSLHENLWKSDIHFSMLNEHLEHYNEIHITIGE